MILTFMLLSPIQHFCVKNGYLRNVFVPQPNDQHHAFWYPSANQIMLMMHININIEVRMNMKSEFREIP